MDIFSQLSVEMECIQIPITSCSSYSQAENKVAIPEIMSTLFTYGKKWVLYFPPVTIHSFFYKHMNFLAEAFAKHILCLFFSTKAFMCYVLNFFEKKAFMCLFSQVNYIEKKPFLAKLCLWCAYFFRQKPSCAMCLIFSKKSLHVLNWPCAYKKMSVYMWN